MRRMPVVMALLAAAHWGGGPVAAATAPEFLAPASVSGPGPDSVRVLIVYYSRTGNTEAMARAVVEGARRVEGAEVTLGTVEEVTAEDLERADALIIGSPTYWATIAAPVKQFIDNWRVFLGDKVGGAFATGANQTGGKELVVVSLLAAMLNNGMIVVGPLYEEDGIQYGGLGASAATGRSGPGVSEFEADDARRLGERVARVALRLAGTR